MVSEAFFYTLKVEMIHDTHWNARFKAKAIFEYIEIYYNKSSRL